MKINKFFWKITLLFSVVLIFSFMSPKIANGDSGTPILKIEANNLSFNDSVYIKYAVSYENTAKQNVSLLIWTEAQSDYTIANKEHQLSSVGTTTVGEKTCLVFDFKELSAKQMTDDVYARAYTRLNNVDYYSPVQKYSILQYAYNKLGRTGPASDNENLKALLMQMLDYGAIAQTYFNYKTGFLATDAFYQIKVIGGTLDDLCTKGLYKPGTQIALSAPAIDANGNVFLYWSNDVGTLIGTTPALNYTVSEKNETLKPVYSGLEIESNGDGTACVVGRGTQAESDLIIPAYTTAGDSVTEIDSSAFAGENIKSVTMPATVTSIGRKAFYGCSLLTDVYYHGTEAEWNAILIGNNNQPLSDANIHYLEECLVIFQNWDGSELGRQTVEKGKAVLPPTDPTRDGYRFVGWSQNYAKIEEDCIISAMFIVNSEADSEFSYIYFEDGKYLGTKENPYMIFLGRKNVSEFSTLHPKTKLVLGGPIINDGSYSSPANSLSFPEGVEVIERVSLINGFSYYYTIDSLPETLISADFLSVSDIGGNQSYNIYEGGKYLGNENNPHVALIKAGSSAANQISPETKLIGNYAFSGYSFTNIVIPGNVVSMGKQAFDGMNSVLQTIDYGGTTAQWESAFPYSNIVGFKNSSVSGGTKIGEVSVICTDGTLTLDVLQSGK